MYGVEVLVDERGKDAGIPGCESKQLYNIGTARRWRKFQDRKIIGRVCLLDGRWRSDSWLECQWLTAWPFSNASSFWLVSYLSVCLAVCLSACLPACLPGWLSVCLSICLSVGPSVRPSVGLSVLSVLSTFLLIQLAIYRFFYLSALVIWCWFMVVACCQLLLVAAVGGWLWVVGFGCWLIDY